MATLYDYGPCMVFRMRSASGLVLARAKISLRLTVLCSQAQKIGVPLLLKRVRFISHFGAVSAAASWGCFRKGDIVVPPLITAQVTHLRMSAARLFQATLMMGPIGGNEWE